MIKKNLKTMILTSIIILLPMVAGLVLWNQLPDEMATHFGSEGEANGWSSKPFTVIGIPFVLLVLHWFCAYFTDADPKKQNISDKMMILVLWLVPTISLVGCGSIYLYALDNTRNTTPIGMMLLGMMFLIIGNYMPKMRQSYTLGIKLPWTLHSEENWNRTHHMASRVFMIGGLLIFFVVFMDWDWMIGGIIFAVVLIPTIYSYCLHKKGI